MTISMQHGTVVASGKQLRSRSLKYDFTQEPLEKVAIEVYKGQSVIQQTNAANRHILQSDGTVQTFAPNEVAFVVGEGVVSQGEATNILEESKCVTGFSANGVFPPVVTDNFTYLGDLWTKIAIPTQIKQTGNDRAQAIRNSFGFRANYSLGVNLTAKITVALDRELTGNEEILIYYTGNTSVGSLRVNSQNSHEFLGNGREVEIKKTGLTDNTGVVYPALLNLEELTSPLSVFYKNGQVIEGNTSGGSWIETTGSPATRPADETTTSTFVEKGVWLDDSNDNPFTVGEYNEPPYVNGIYKYNDTRFNLVTAGGINSKYRGSLNTSWIGAICTVGEHSFRIDSLGNTNRVGCEMVRGNTDECISLLRAFEPIKADFTTSDYWTGDFTADTQALKDLRTAAGDDVSTIKEAKLMKSNDFEISFDMELLEDVATNDDDYPNLFTHGESISNRLLLTLTKSDPTRCYISRYDPERGDISVITFQDAPIVAGTVLKVVIRQSSETGLTLNVNGKESTNATLVHPIPLDKEMYFGRRGKAEINNIIKNFKYRDLPIVSQETYATDSQGNRMTDSEGNYIIL